MFCLFCSQGFQNAANGQIADLQDNAISLFCCVLHGKLAGIFHADQCCWIDHNTMAILKFFVLITGTLIAIGTLYVDFHMRFVN